MLTEKWCSGDIFNFAFSRNAGTEENPTNVDLPSCCSDLNEVVVILCVENDVSD